MTNIRIASDFPAKDSSIFRLSKKMNFTFLTISNSNEDLALTYKSIKKWIIKGSQWVVVSTINIPDRYKNSSSKRIIGKDSGLYNALNIGISNIETEFFMIIHSGDQLDAEFNLKKELNNMKSFKLDLTLGASLIGRRKHSSKYWKKWMFDFYVQPPHLPIIYSRSFVNDVRFREDLKVVSDFFMLRELFRKDPNYTIADQQRVIMKTGGLTSSGLSSIILVTRELAKGSGSIQPFLLLPVRLILKLL
ncbi:hypothetical protein OAG67_00790 [bacterium]|nr:hypothetical protein [bacterium]